MKLHGNAAPSLKKRRLLCERVLGERSLAGAAPAAEVSERTARKWIRRFQAEGARLEGAARRRCASRQRTHFHWTVTYLCET